MNPEEKEFIPPWANEQLYRDGNEGLCLGIAFDCSDRERRKGSLYVKLLEAH